MTKTQRSKRVHAMYREAFQKALVTASRQVAEEMHPKQDEGDEFLLNAAMAMAHGAAHIMQEVTITNEPAWRALTEAAWQNALNERRRLS